MMNDLVEKHKTPSKPAIAFAVAAFAFAASTFFIPDNSISKNISASLDPGFYVRVPWGKIEPGAIVQFPVPERAFATAKRFKMSTDIPLMKRVESVMPDGKLIVQSDCGTAETALDSTFFGPISQGEVIGVYAPIVWTTTPCEVAIAEMKRKATPR